jgi:hypothetical protein
MSEGEKETQTLLAECATPRFDSEKETRDDLVAIHPVDEKTVAKYICGPVPIKLPTHDIYVRARKQVIHVEVPGATKMLLDDVGERSLVFFADRIKTSMRSEPCKTRNMFCGVYAMRIVIPMDMNRYRLRQLQDGTIQISICREANMWTGENIKGFFRKIENAWKRNPIKRSQK